MSFIADDGFSFLDAYRDRSNGGDESENERSHVSSKKDFDFSFIGYRDRIDDEDESDSDHSHLIPSFSMSEEEGNDEQECMCHTGADSFELPQSPAAAETPVEGLEDSDDEDEGVEGGWGELIASFGELDKCDEGTSGEGSGCHFDFSFSFGESKSTEEEGDDDEEEIASEGDVFPQTNTTDPSGEANNDATPRRSFSVNEVLRDGLIFAGFTDERITRCGEKRNTDRFKAQYGVCPKTVASFLGDHFHKHPSLKYKDIFMTLYWLKTYSVAHVMSAIWGPCEEYINPVLEDYIAKFASLKEGKIRWDRFNDASL